MYLHSERRLLMSELSISLGHRLIDLRIEEIQVVEVEARKFPTRTFDDVYLDARTAALATIRSVGPTTGRPPSWRRRPRSREQHLCHQGVLAGRLPVRRDLDGRCACASSLTGLLCRAVPHGDEQLAGTSLRSPASPHAGSPNLAAFTVTLSLFGPLSIACSPAGCDPSRTEEGKAHARGEHQKVAEIIGHRRKFAAVRAPRAANSRLLGAHNAGGKILRELGGMRMEYCR